MLAFTHIYLSHLHVHGESNHMRMNLRSRKLFSPKTRPLQTHSLENMDPIPQTTSLTPQASTADTLNKENVQALVNMTPNRRRRLTDLINQNDL